MIVDCAAVVLVLLFLINIQFRFLLFIGGG
jgi:hypothetical protein